MKSKETIEEIRDILDKKESETHLAINSFFDILFWKNASNGYLEVKDKQSILTKIEKSIKSYGEFEHLDTAGILPFINKIRTQIGLPELTLELGYLAELTDDTRRLIMLKRLE